jgi:hypothetical protein
MATNEKEQTVNALPTAAELTRPKNLPTAAETAELAQSAARSAWDRALDPSAHDDLLDLASRAWRERGDARSARAYAALHGASRQMDYHLAERADERASEAAERAERVAKIRASGQRMALPDLDAGLKGRS